jgi:hypothetical protein
MKIKDLIKILNEVEDKNKTVCIYNLNNGLIKVLEDYDIDFSIDNRLDINVDF